MKIATGETLTDTLPEGVAPLSFDGDMTLVERDRTLFVAEDPEGEYTRYDPGTGEFVPREAITGEFLQAVADNSDPENGAIVKQGDKDYSAQLAIGHEENKKFLHAANLASAGDVKRVIYDPKTGKLSVRVSMPKQVAAWQDAGLFPKVSARFYEEYPKKGGGTLGPALAHVAALGTMAPVSKNLGPWSPALFSDNAEVALANAKKAGLKTFSMAKGDLVLDFAEHDIDAAGLRTRIMEKVVAEAETQIEFVVVELAETAGVTPEEVMRFVDGDTDELNDAARKALLRFVGIPTMATGDAEGDDEDEEGEEGDDAPAEGEGEEAGEGEDEVEETEPEGGEQFGETDMADHKKKKPAPKPKPKGKGKVTAPTAKDFAEIQGQVRDLTFILKAQGEKLKTQGTTHGEMAAQLADQKKATRKERILAFAEKMHGSGRLPGRARKALVTEYLEGVGAENDRVRDFGETETKDELDRAMEFVEKVAPQAVDTTGRIIAADSDPATMDFAEMDKELSDYREYKQLAKKDGFPTNLTFKQFAEAQNHDPELVEAFCREKKLTHPNIKDGNAE